MRLVRIRIAVAVLSAAAIAWSLWHLQGLRDGLVVTTDRAGVIPVTIWRNDSASAAPPVVVIAHGFAGSQQLMQPFAITLARNGYVAVTFDFPGHGRNPQPLSGGLTDAHAMQHDLLAALDQVSRYALALPNTDGRLAVLGHSMAADIVVRYADSNPLVLGTVAVSMFLPTLAKLHPSNLIIIDGALEPAMLRDQAFAIVGESVDATVQAAQTYGNFADGSARRIAFARGVEHIGVLYSVDSMHESLAWLDDVFHRHGDGLIDHRGPWLGLLLLGLVALAWPLSTLLPQLSDALPQRSIRWRGLLAVAVLPAILTPLILWRIPTQFLPILLGDYLTLHFGLYGVLTALGVMVLRHRARRPASGPMHVAASAIQTAEIKQPIVNGSAMTPFVMSVALVTAYSVLAIGLALNTYVFSFLPGTWRLPLIAVVLLGTLPYFLADEWLTRRCAAIRGSYVLSKLCLLLSLVIAIALNLEKLFFLLIIVPAILLLFIIYGLFSRWVYRRTQNPFVAGFANAIVFAWFIGVTFPIVSR